MTLAPGLSAGATEWRVDSISPGQRWLSHNRSRPPEPLTSTVEEIVGAPSAASKNALSPLRRPTRGGRRGGAGRHPSPCRTLGRSSAPCREPVRRAPPRPRNPTDRGRPASPPPTHAQATGGVMRNHLLDRRPPTSVTDTTLRKPGLQGKCPRVRSTPSGSTGPRAFRKRFPAPPDTAGPPDSTSPPAPVGHTTRGTWSTEVIGVRDHPGRSADRPGRPSCADSGVHHGLRIIARRYLVADVCVTMVNGHHPVRRATGRR